MRVFYVLNPLLLERAEIDRVALVLLLYLLSYLAIYRYLTFVKLDTLVRDEISSVYFYRNTDIYLLN